MMEAAGFVATVLVLGLIGLGPAVMLISRGPQRLTWAACAAPTIGLGLVGLLGFPLLRWFAPAERWALPLTLILLSVSFFLLFWDITNSRRIYHEAAAAAVRSRLRLVILLAVCLVVVLFLAAPLFVGGIDYAVFRGNPSDAFTYISLAESFRTVDFDTLVAGGAMRDLSAVQRLAEASPTALFTARFVLWPIRLMTQVPLAWAAELWHIPVYRFLYPYELVSFVLGFLMAIVVGRQLRLSRGWAVIGALAITFGFWARYLLEIDAAARTNLVPLFLLLAFAWLQLELSPQRVWSRERVLLAFAAAVLAAFYPQAVPLVVVAFALYYGLGLLQRVVTWKAVFLHLATLLVAAIFLGGYIDFAMRTLLWQTPVVVGDTSALTQTDALHFLRTDGPAALWGLPGSVLVGGASRYVNWAVRALLAAFGFLITLLFIWGGLQAVRNPRRDGQDIPSVQVERTGLRLHLALILSGFLVAALMFMAGTYWASGRAVTYVYPFLVVSLLAVLRDARRVWQPKLASIALLLTAAWLAASIVIGATIPLNTSVTGDAFSAGRDNKPENYDLAPIVDALRQAEPRLLAVDIPVTENWTFPYYTINVFAEFPVHYLSGLIYDNSVNYRNLWLRAPAEAPDYAVVSKNNDFIAGRKLGEQVAETEDLVLYRITTTNAALFALRQAALEQRDEGKLSFPGLQMTPN